jgi:hypothetical protein
LVLGETINQILKQRIIKILFPKKALSTVAVDITADPVSGKKTKPAVTGGKPKAGTWYVHTYGTFCVVVGGRDIALQSMGCYSLTQLRMVMVAEIIMKELQWLKDHHVCDAIGPSWTAGLLVRMTITNLLTRRSSF